MQIFSFKLFENSLKLYFNYCEIIFENEQKIEKFNIDFEFNHHSIYYLSCYCTTLRTRPCSTVELTTIAMKDDKKRENGK